MVEPPTLAQGQVAERAEPIEDLRQHLNELQAALHSDNDPTPQSPQTGNLQLRILREQVFAFSSHLNSVVGLVFELKEEVNKQKERQTALEEEHSKQRRSSSGGSEKELAFPTFRSSKMKELELRRPYEKVGMASLVKSMGFDSLVQEMEASGQKDKSSQVNDRAMKVVESMLGLMLDMKGEVKFSREDTSALRRDTTRWIDLIQNRYNLLSDQVSQAITQISEAIIHFRGTTAEMQAHLETSAENGGQAPATPAADYFLPESEPAEGLPEASSRPLSAAATPCTSWHVSPASARVSVSVPVSGGPQPAGVSSTGTGTPRHPAMTGTLHAGAPRPHRASLGSPGSGRETPNFPRRGSRSKPS